MTVQEGIYERMREEAEQIISPIPEGLIVAMEPRRFTITTERFHFAVRLEVVAFILFNDLLEPFSFGREQIKLE